MVVKWWQKVLFGRPSRPVGAHLRQRLQVEVLEVRENPAATASIFAATAIAGSAPTIPVYNSTTQQQQFNINAYASSFTGGVNVAIGDVNGDGTPDIITGAGPGGGPVVNVYSGTDGTLLKSFTVGDPNSRAGVTVAAANFEGTGTDDILVGTMQNGQPLVEVIRFADQSVVSSFTPFAGATGVSVAAGDVNGDGTPDVVAGSGKGIASQVIVFSGKDQSQLLSVAPFESTFTGGVTVAAGDLNGDGKAEVIVSASIGGGPRVQVYDGATGTVFQNFFAYSSTQRVGVQASAFDPTGSGSPNLVTTDGPGEPANPQAFNGKTLAPLAPPSVAALPISIYAPLSSSSGSGSGGTTGSLPFSLTDPSWQAQSSGIRTWDVTVGTGATVQVGSQITVNYIGYLTNGTIFDSSFSRNQPLSTTLDTSHLIAGFVDGVAGMKVGGERRVDIPSSLGYGAAGQGSTIPPNAELIFDITLVSTP